MYYSYNNRRDFSVLLGRVLTAVEVDSSYDDKIVFKTEDGREFVQYHQQDCCESVSIEEIIGDVSDLVNDGPILLAEEVSERGEGNDWESSTWTFYKLRTRNGDVTIRWLGTSNGYYSESVDFYETTDAVLAR